MTSMSSRSWLELCLMVPLLCVAASAQTQPAHIQEGKTVAERLGYPVDARLLIIHAEDLGMAHSVNRATMESLEKGWVTSASIMVPCPWFPEVAQWAKSHPDADLGIHLTLNSDWADYKWGPVSALPKGSSLLDADGYLPAVTLVSDAKASEAEQEFRAQIDRALAAGVRISHLDEHARSILSSPDLFRAYWDTGQKYRLPVQVQRRQLRPQQTESGASSYVLKGVTVAPESVLVDRVIELKTGMPQSQWMAAYKGVLANLPAGVHQLIVHLGYDDAELRAITRDHPRWGAAWRQNDFDVVRSPEFQQFLKDQKFVLIGWKDLNKLLPHHQPKL